MRKIYILFIIVSCICSPSVSYTEEERSSGEVTTEEEGPSLIAVALYLPNRVFDLLDIFRARVRIGPGFAVSARATRYADLYLGSYTSLYAGLPGPRGRTIPRLPVGLESHNGATVSVVDATVDGGMGPEYGSTEVGVGIQLGIIGVDVGIDPGEILDFFLGWGTVDLKEDDF